VWKKVEFKPTTKSWEFCSMDSEIRDEVPSRKQFSVLKTLKRKKVFINGELHQIVHINIPADILTTFNFIQNKMLRYPYKAIKPSMQKAYMIGEVATVVNRHKDRIRCAIREGGVPQPQKAGPNGKKYFNAEDILNIQDYFANVHFGRPRNDGAITPKRNSVTKEEVDARLGRREVLYVQNDNGEFIPVWRTMDF